MVSATSAPTRPALRGAPLVGEVAAAAFFGVLIVIGKSLLH